MDNHVDPEIIEMLQQLDSMKKHVSATVEHQNALGNQLANTIAKNEVLVDINRMNMISMRRESKVTEISIISMLVSWVITALVLGWWTMYC